MIVDKIYEIIREINEQGVTILLVEQNANYALDVSARGYVLETGTVALSDKSAALRNDERVKAAYLGDMTVSHLAALGAKAFYLLVHLARLGDRRQLAVRTTRATARSGAWAPACCSSVIGVIDLADRAGQAGLEVGGPPPRRGPRRGLSHGRATAARRPGLVEVRVRERVAELERARGHRALALGDDLGHVAVEQPDREAPGRARRRGGAARGRAPWRSRVGDGLGRAWR